VFLLKDSWTNAKKVIGTSTVNNLKAPEEDTNTIIDFIFTTPEFTTRKMTIISTKSGEHFLSDHNIIVADMIM
jgi:endonuclease/exonuclease/phosphatase family metal-dependent hydrolase